MSKEAALTHIARMDILDKLSGFLKNYSLTLKLRNAVFSEKKDCPEASELLNKQEALNLLIVRESARLGERINMALETQDNYYELLLKIFDEHL